MKVPPPTGREHDETVSPSKPSSPDERSTRRFKRLLKEWPEDQQQPDPNASAGDPGQGRDRTEDHPGSRLPSETSPPKPFPGEVSSNRSLSQSGKEERHRQRDEHTRKRGDHRVHPENTEQVRYQPGERILAGLTGSLSEPDQSGDGSVSAMGELARRLADQILVTAPATFQSREVRIQLKDSVLHGTEILLHKKQGGVEIQFLASDPEVLKMLNAHLDDLQQALGTRLGDRLPVSIVVITPDAGAGTSDDGRSRNRRQFNEERDPDDE